MKTKIYIFNPSIRNGGTNNLLTNLAICISQLNTIDLHVIDFNNGLCFKRLKENKIKFTEIEYDVTKKVIIEDGVLISILLHLKHIVNKHIIVSSKTRLVLWSTHPYDSKKIVPSFNLLLKFKNYKAQKIIASILHPFYFKNLKCFFQIAAAQKGLVYMDNLNFESTSRFYEIQKHKIIWPLVTSNSSVFKKNSTSTKKKLKITFLNRIVDFKYYPTVAFLYQIKEMKIEKKFELIFIGDGPFRNDLKRQLDLLKFDDYKILGNVNVSELDKLLINTDVCISSATSALEAAKLKIPTICLPFFYNEIDYRKMRLKWLYDINGVELGEQILIFNKNDYEEYLLKFKKIFSSPIMLQDIGNRCYEKWELDFSYEKLKSLFLMNLKNNNFYLTLELKKMLKQDLLSKLIFFLKRKILKKFQLIGEGFSLKRRS